MIYFTSDWHIGHDKEFLWGKRGFTNIFDHDTAVIKNCNKLVQPEDELWILGDLAMGINESEWDRIFYNIKCQNVHFVIGNHDSDKRIDKYIDEYRLEFHGYVDVMKYSKKTRLYLSHYPTITDNFDDGKNNYTISICGHSHYKNRFQDMDKGLIYHVELDAHNMYPVSIEQIIKDITSFTSSDINVQKSLIKNGI